MTWGIFSIGWLDLNNEVKASELFTRSYFPYVRQPFKVRIVSLFGLNNSKKIMLSKGTFTEFSLLLNPLDLPYPFHCSRLCKLRGSVGIQKGKQKLHNMRVETSNVQLLKCKDGFLQTVQHCTFWCIQFPSPL